MPDKKVMYTVTTDDGRTEQWDQKTYDELSPSLYESYPGAKVARVSAYDPADDDGNETDRFQVQTGDGRVEQWSRGEFNELYGSLKESYPDAEVYRISDMSDRYWRPKLDESKKALADFDTTNGEVMRQYEQALRDSNKVARNASLSPAQKYVAENREQYESLKRQRDSLGRAVYDNPIIQEGRRAAVDNATKLREEYLANAESAATGEERRDWKRAAKLQQDAAELFSAPSQYQENGFADYLKDYWAGAKNTFSDKDFWTRGLTQITRDFDLYGIRNKVAEAEKEKGGELDESDFDRVLTPGEKAQLFAAYNLAYAQADEEIGRAKDLPSAYRAGSSAAESLGFMAEFMLGTGIMNATGKAILKGSKSAMARWLGEALMSDNAINDAVKKGLIKQVERTSLQELGRTAAQSLVKGAGHTIAQPLGLMSNVAQRMNETDDEGELNSFWESFGTGLADTLIENWSESFGQTIDVGFNAAGKGIGKLGMAKAKTDFGKIARWAMNSDFSKRLTEAGFNGFFGEMLEEWAGNAVRLATGVIDKEEFDQFASVQQQLEMAASFAPMSIIGLAGSVGGARRHALNFDKESAAVRDILMKNGVSQPEIDKIFNEKWATSDDIAAALAPYAQKVLDEGGETAAEDYATILNFAGEFGKNAFFEAAKEYKNESLRNTMRESIKSTVGQDFWMNIPYTQGDEVVDNPMVRVFTGPDGVPAYIVAEDKSEENGWTFSYVDENGKKGFVNEGDIPEGYQAVGLNDYLQQRVDQQRAAEEAERMRQEEQAKLQAVRQRVMQDPNIELGTPEAPKPATVVPETATPQGVSVVVNDENGQHAETLTWQQVGDHVGIPTTAKSDEELADEAAAEMETLARRKDEYNQIPVGTPITVMEQTGEENPEPVQYRFAKAIYDENEDFVRVYVMDENGDILTDSEGNEFWYPDMMVPDLGAVAENAVAQKNAVQENAEPAMSAVQEEPAAEDVVSRYTDPQTGEVDQDAMLNDNPEAWARWNDERLQDGGADSAQAMEAAIKSLDKQIGEVEKKLADEASPKTRDALRETRSQLQQRRDRLAPILDGYVQQQAAAEQEAEAAAQQEAVPIEETAPVEEQQPVAETPSVQPEGRPLAEAPARPLNPVQEQALETLGEDPRQAVITVAQTKLDELAKRITPEMPEEERAAVNAEKAVVLQEMFDRNGAKNTVTTTMSGIVEQMKARGSSEKALADVQAALADCAANGDVIEGFYDRSSDTVFMVSDNLGDAKHASRIHTHESKHMENRRTSAHASALNTGVTQNELENAVRKYKKTNYYDGKSALTLADETLAIAAEIAEEEGIDAVPQRLRELGILNEKFINFAQNNVDYGKRNGQRRTLAGRESLQHTDEEVRGGQDGRNPEAESSNVGESGARPVEGSAQGGERGESAESAVSQPGLSPDQEAVISQHELAKEGVASNEEESRFSVRYVPAEEKVDGIAEDISRLLGIPKEQSLRWVKSETSLAPIILDEHNSPFLNYEADGRYAAIKEDSDYPQGTVDFNNICRKRIAFTNVFQRLQRDFPNTVITGTDLAKIRQIMKDNGYTVACGLCYVEDRRQLLGEIARFFIEEMNSGFEGYIHGRTIDQPAGGKVNATKEKRANALKGLIGDDVKEDLNIYDLITLEGSDKLQKEHPGIYAAFQRFNAYRGQQAGNLFQGYAEYKREIQYWADETVAKVNSLGGLRIFSYSDFEAHHLIDLVQIIQDCAKRGVMIQGYTKVPAFARAVANTNIKLNRSLIPLGDTGIVDGQLAFDPVEGIDINDPDFIESNDNVGNVLVGINDEQIRLAMADPRIHYIIPYHSNQKGILRQMKQTGAWMNYKNEQTEKGEGVGKHGVNIYTDVLSAAEAEGRPITNEREFVEKFLQVCKERGWTPRFARFLNTNEAGEYVYAPGYYKLLLDFKMFDEAGNILPQKPVVAEFDDAFNQKILEDYVKDAQTEQNIVPDDVYEDIVDALDLHPSAETQELTEAQKKALAFVNGETAKEEDDEVRMSMVGLDELEKDGIVVDNPAMLKEYGLSSLTLTKNGDVVTINKVVADEKGNGAGTRFMNELSCEADGNGWTLALTPDDAFGATSVSRLKKFYKRFGFKENKGKNTDFTISESMVREPQKNLMFSITTYHGTGADFERFDHSHMGEGEGSQVYGWGTYVTTNKDTGVAYAESIGGNTSHNEEMIRRFNEELKNPDITQERKQQLEDAIVERQSEIDAFKGHRHLYTVAIPDDNGRNYIHWEKPLTREQSNRIMDIVRQNADKKAFGEEFEYELKSALGPGTYGRYVEGGLDYFLGNEYNYATDENPGAERNAKLLSKAGFIGFEIPVDLNGGKNYEGSNYVIFDEDDLDIEDHIRFSLRGILGAQNDDLAMADLEVAEDMEAEGKSAKAIWAATGWERGKDGKWRNEIPDGKAKPIPMGKRVLTAGDLIDAPELFDSYPALKDYKVVIKKTSSAGSYSRDKKEIELDNDYNFTITVPEEKQEAAREYFHEHFSKDPTHPATLRREMEKKFGVRQLDSTGISTMMHELQHAIQHIEGFARGGNKEAQQRDYLEQVYMTKPALVSFARVYSRKNPMSRLLRAGRERIIKLLENAISSGAYNGEPQRRFEELRDYLAGIDDYAYRKFVEEASRLWKGSFSKGREMYNKLAGETESRNVEKRMGMSGTERLSTPPSETEDVPREEQIVRFSVSADIAAKYPNWMDNQTSTEVEGSKRGQNTQVAGTVGTYKKVGSWIDKNIGKDAQILDASSGLGLGTLELRSQGFNVDDIEPYPGKGREEQPTYGGVDAYQKAMDDGKEYDYIISNAVLNVIPDDWRNGVLHDMATLLKPGGRMFINTRKAGEEKTIKNKIELESPQEVLVGTPERITSYQRFFTLSELQEYVQGQLGDGYTVELANKSNSGTSGLAAVVVTKKEQEADRLSRIMNPVIVKSNTEASEIVKKIINKPLHNSKLGMMAIITGNDLSKMNSDKATHKSKDTRLHAIALANVQMLFETAGVDVEQPDSKGRSSVKTVHRIGSTFYDNETAQFIPVKLTVLEFNKDGNHIYTIEAVDIEKEKSAGQLVARADASEQTPNADFTAKIEKFIEETREAVNNLSKDVIDNNNDLLFSVANAHQEMFVSNAQRAVENIRQEKATPEQWLKMVEKNGGLKAGEDKWLGLSQWLKDSDKKTLTKQEILDYIEENKIKIEETRYGRSLKDEIQDTIGEGRSLDELQEEIDDLKESAGRYDAIGQNPTDEEMDQYLRDAMVEEYGDDFNMGYVIDGGQIDYNVDPYADAEYAENYDGPGHPINNTRREYTTDGLENKREIALTVPTIDPWNEDDKIHFGDAGEGRAVAWIRFGDAAKDGQRVLFIDEIQSKRHQEGREQGYQIPIGGETIGEYAEDVENKDFVAPIYNKAGNKIGKMHQDPMAGWWVENNDGSFMSSTRNTEADALSSLVRHLGESGIPAAPFEKNWQELSMKRMLRLAAEEGYDYVAWTKGEQQAERYDLSRTIHGLTVYDNGDGTYDLLTLSADGTQQQSYSRIEQDKLADYVGKELAVKIARGENQEERKGRKVQYYRGLDLKIGGEGMKGFYDEMLPRFMNKYGNQWGVKVEDITLPGLENGSLSAHAVPVTQEMKDSVMEGQLMFSVSGQEQADRQGLIDAAETGGLKAVLGEENLQDFYREAYASIPQSALRPIVESGLANGGDIMSQLRIYLHDLARNGAENDETGLLFKLYDDIRFMTANPALTDNDIRWMIWKETADTRPGDLLSMAEDRAMRNRWGVGAEPAEQQFQQAAEETAKEAEARVETAKKELKEEKKATYGPVEAIAKAMAAQKTYDRATVDSIVKAAKDMLKAGNVSALNRREVSRLLTLVSTSAGKSQKSVTRYADQLVEMMLNHIVAEEEAKFMKLVKVKASKVSDSGVEVRGKLDIIGQAIIKEFRENMASSVDDIQKRMIKVSDDLDSKDDAVRREAVAKYRALMMALQYKENIAENIEEYKDLKEEFDAAGVKLADVIGRKAYDEFVKQSRDALRKNMMERIDMYRDLGKQLSDVITGSAEAAAALRKMEQERIDEIHHDASRDMKGTPNIEHLKENIWQRFLNSDFVRFFLKPLSTADQMFRLLGRKSVTGEGYLFSRYIKNGFIPASEKASKGFFEATEILDKKASEVFGKKMKWSDLYKESRKKGGDVKFLDGGEIRSHEVSVGNLLYIYMADKMTDGKMKLRRMGISEEDVEKIKKSIDPRLIELADWMQNEFYVNLRNKYNEVHERMFGAPMAAIEDYVPLKILANARFENVDVGNTQNQGAMSSTITGSIIKRRRNSLALDILHTDAFSLAIEHIQQMEDWAAFAELRRDMNTLLSYQHFRNQVKNMETIYGTGDKLWKTFEDVCQVLVGKYQPRVRQGDTDSIALNVSKGVTAAKIAFRVNTAIKQILSFPAYLSDARVDFLAKSVATPGKSWKWCMENLPLFEKRWKSRIAGDTRLLDTDSDWKIWRDNVVKTASRLGMTPNAFVDATTVAIGAKAMYDTKRARYIKDGYSEEEADEMAKKDAEILYNQTQQSSENAFVSPVQLDRTVEAVTLTTYRNSSMAYQRQLHDAIRTLARMMKPGYRQRSIDFMTHQNENNGLEEEEAREAATRQYNRQYFRNLVRVAVFGYGLQFLWKIGNDMWYLLFGDDDDEKDKIIKEAAIAELAGPVEGLLGGNVISDIRGKRVEKASNEEYGIKTSSFGQSSGLAKLPIESDTENILNRWDNDRPRAVNDIIDLIVQSGIGVNPQTLTDAVVAIIDYENGDLDKSKEMALLMMRILQMPQSTVEKFLVDEIDMDAEPEARKEQINNLAKRYAMYKLLKNTTVANRMYDEGKRDKKLESYEKQFKDAVKKRIAIKETASGEEIPETPEDFYKGFEKDMKKFQTEYNRTDEKHDNDTLTRRVIEESPEFQQYLIWKKHQSVLNKLNKGIENTMDENLRKKWEGERRDEIQALINELNEIK